MSDLPSNACMHACMLAQPCRAASAAMMARSIAAIVISAGNLNPESWLNWGLAKCGVAMLGSVEVRDQHGLCV